MRNKLTGTFNKLYAVHFCIEDLMMSSMCLNGFIWLFFFVFFLKVPNEIYLYIFKKYSHMRYKILYVY